jgi:hypothetical protein
VALWGSASVSLNLWCTLWSRAHSTTSFWKKIQRSVAEDTYPKITLLLICSFTTKKHKRCVRKY